MGLWLSWGGVRPLLGEAGSKARIGSLVAGIGDSGSGACPLVGGARSQGLCMQGPGCPRSSACPVVCRAWSLALWWAGLCPGEGVGSGGLKADCLLLGGAVSLPS